MPYVHEKAGKGHQKKRQDDSGDAPSSPPSVPKKHDKKKKEKKEKKEKCSSSSSTQVPCPSSSSSSSCKPKKCKPVASVVVIKAGPRVGLTPIPPPPPPPFVLSADYVIVGAGAAGAVLANRLALRGAAQGITVILLEAGLRHLDDPNILIPTATFGNLNAIDQNVGPSSDPKYSWQAALEPDKGAYGVRNVIANGRQWGGSGAVNSMAYVNGGSTVFNQEWPAGWSYNDIEPYLAAVEAAIQPYHDPFKLIPTQTLLAGLQQLAIQQQTAGITSFLTNVATQSTLSSIEGPSPSAPYVDYNDLPGINSVCTFSAFQFFVNQLADGTFIRKFSGNTYLNATQVDPTTGKGIGPLSGLQVISNAFVNRILFETPPGGVTPTATGVLYLDEQSRTHTVQAKREVIVCGGAFQSPTLLQRSGVGDFALLADNQIPYRIASNPQVGLNLRNDYSPLVAIRVLGTPANVATFMDGIFNTTGGNLGYRGGAFFNFHPLEPNKPANYQQVSYRKYQLLFFGSLTFLSSLAQFQYGFSAAANNSLLMAMDDIRFAPVGSVKAPIAGIALDTPNIFFNTLTSYTPNATDPVDVQLAALQATEAATISAILAYDIAYQTVVAMDAYAFPLYNVHLEIGIPAPTSILVALNAKLAEYGPIWWHYLAPALVVLAGETPDPAFSDLLAQLQFFARTVAHIDSHQMGTNALTKAVDTQLKVNGVNGLRVGDLSVTPQPPGGNTAAPAMAIGAKCADLLLGLPPL